MDKIIIDYSPAWSCENLDNLAPIDWQGYELLFADGSRELVDNLDNLKYRMADEDEVKNFYRQQGHLFIGDKVKIIKGRKLPIGEIKTISGFYRYNVPCTYSKVGTDYILFDDNTRTSIYNVQSIVAPNKRVMKHVKWNTGGRK